MAIQQINNLNKCYGGWKYIHLYFQSLQTIIQCNFSSLFSCSPIKDEGDKININDYR